MRLQIKRWAASTPGWSITSLFMTASKFDSAPTGSSTIMRFLKPEGSPESTAHGPALSGSAAVLEQPSAAQGVSSAAETHESIAAAVPNTAEAGHSLSGNQACVAAEAAEATAHTSREGFPLPEHRGPASVWQGSSSRQLGGLACQGVEDAGSRTPPLHSMSMALSHARQPHLPEEASGADPANQLPGSSRHTQEIPKQTLNQTMPADVVARSCAAGEALPGSDATAWRKELAAPAHAGEGKAALQREQASEHYEPEHSAAANAHNAEALQSVSRQLPNSELLDGVVVGKLHDGESRSCQKVDGIVEVPRDDAPESRQQSIAEGTRGEGISCFSHPSHQVQPSLSNILNVLHTYRLARFTCTCLLSTLDASPEPEMQ